MNKFISALCYRKSHDANKLHSEVIKRGCKRLLKVLYIIKDAWENLEVPVDWKDTQLVTIFKMRLWRLLWDLTSFHKGKCWPANCSIDYQPEWRISCLRHNVNSTQTEEPWTWSSCNKYRRNVLNRICPFTWFVISQNTLILWIRKYDRTSYEN